MANDDNSIKNPCGPGEPQSPTPNATAQKPSAGAQEVSSKQNSQSVRPRATNTMNLNEIFAPRKFTQFYTIKSTGESNLARLNMFHVDKAIRKQIGNCEKISEDFTNKTWTIQVKSEQQGKKLTEMRLLLTEPVTVVPHEWHNQSQGVITCALLKGYKDEEIAEGLSEQGVIQCRRIIKQPKSDNPIPTTTLILTFNSSHPPDRVIIRTGLSERVRQYIPMPRRCFKCQHYGHSGAKCRREYPVCVRCGDEMRGDHNTETCQLPINCVHCNEPHSVTSRTCPRYLLEKEILSIKTKEHLTFAEARSKINMNFGITNRSYAATVTEKNPISEPQQKPSTDKNNNVTAASTSNSVKQRTP